MGTAWRPKHPRLVRWSHWINFPLITLMIWSGLLIYWANDVYYLGFGPHALKLFPKPWFAALGWSYRLAEGMAWHFFLQWLFILNGAAYVAYAAISGEWRELWPGRRALRDAWQVVRHDLGLRKEPLPPAKFNAAQRLAYAGVVVMGAGSVVTGLVMFKPVQLHAVAWCLGGYASARWIHFWLTLGYVGFFFVHVAQVARAGWNNLRAMVTGYERVPAAAARDGAKREA